MKAIIIQIILILILLAIISIIFNIIKAFIREKRIADFALSKEDFNDLAMLERIKMKFWQIIHSLSKSLGKSKVLEALAHDYDKFIMTSEEEYKSNLDFMTIKILSTIFFVIFITLLITMEVLPNNLLLLVLFIIIGYSFPDLFWNISYNHKKNDISSKLYQSIIIISDELKECNIIEAIKRTITKLDGPIQDEYKKVLIDLSYNISLEDAYIRFYKRTHIKEIKNIYEILGINSANLLAAFSSIRNDLDYIHKKNNITSNINSILNIMSYIYLLIPIVFIIMILVIYPSYFKILKENNFGFIIVIALMLLYFTLILSIKKILEERK